MACNHWFCLLLEALCLCAHGIEPLMVRIHKFLEKSNKRKGHKGKKNEAVECTTADKEEEILRKNVDDLVKKQKLAAVREIMKRLDDTKTWGPVMKTKVGSRLVELLMQTAYIQPPSDQSQDGALDIHPAFVHKFRTATAEAT